MIQRLLALVALVTSAAATPLPWKKVDQYKLILDSAPQTETDPQPIEEWYENQKLDHNDPTNPKRWRQRYHYNAEWFGGKGYPVFYLVNGENVATPTSVTNSILFMNELAVKYKALVVSVEHRYYGLSQPVLDYSIENLQYLTAEQALADFAAVQTYLIQKRNLTADNKWVTFGGSYPGMLAGWAKLKYPNNYVGAVASSAPIWTKVEFVEYSEKVHYGLKLVGGDECVNKVGESLKDFHAVITSTKPEDENLFKTLFKPCSDIKNDYDRMMLEMGQFGNFQWIAQFHGLGKYSLVDVCKHFAKNGTALEKLAGFNDIWSGGACTYVDYERGWIEPLLNTSIDTQGIGRQWSYQTCAEFGFGQTTANSKSIFGAFTFGDLNRVYYDMCRRAFNITNTDERTAATMKKYGGLKNDAANVVWASGSVDPWSALAPTNTTLPLNPSSDVVYTEGTSHCADMYSRSYKKIPAWALDRIESNVDSYLRNKC